MIWVSVAGFVGLAILSMVLTSVEAAFYLIKRRRLSHLTQSPRVERVNRYLEDPPTALMPIQVGTYMAHVLMAAIVTAALLDQLDRWAIAVATLVMVIYLLLFRLTVPYTLVRRNPERALLVLLPVFDLYVRLLAPIVGALRRRADPDAPADSEETSPVPVLEVPPPPALDPDGTRLEESLQRFAEIVVRDVMTPRPDVVAISAAASVADLTRMIRETKCSRLPVFGDNLDDVVGLVTVRDLIEHEGNPADSIKPLMRGIVIVPETKRAADLLKELQARRTTFALVIDEYGGTAGVVTVEDIVEELVGEIKDEFDVESEPIVIEPDGACVVSGQVTVDRLEETLETALTDENAVGTVGGLVTTLFGRIPRTGERTEHRGYSVEVVAAEKKRVNRVRFRRKPAEATG